MRALGNAVTLTAVVLLAVAPRAWAQSPGSKIAFIDVQRVLVRSAAGVAARELLEQRVLQDLSGVIEKVGKERGLVLIVEKRGAAVLYGASEADLTDEIIRAYDQQNPGKDKK